jgi:hypothetical protein
MATFNRVAKIVALPIPRVLSPRVHAGVDYVRIGIFVAGAGRYWRRNKRVAIAALVCAGAETALDLLTDYDGRSGKPLNFHTHRELEIGLASMAAAMPALMGFEKEPARNLFLAQGVASTVVLEITRFPKQPETQKRRRGMVA